ncbi:MAG: proline/glycine betaine ABC transporter permease [SAR202 cluster bacterium]|jgi:glycine betaine/proline transport system permease protein|nr:MAG: proline/glycine betaine ABC transporter permease [SAR202 cluster bacterium]MQG75565.1 proline/glycine betaine ABC transporter permease [SAR202 cluster bacterium]|tara:strand:+ start:5143 stop:6015 length:873 start_codon:yes stop_codon:yes gene_type:complete
MIHGSGVEFALDFPLNVSNEVEGALDDSIDWIVITFGDFFDAVSDAIKVVLGKLRDLLIWIPWPIMMALVFIIGWKVASLKIAIMSLVGLIVLAMVSLWEPTMVTVAIMIVAVFLSIVIGVPVGILAARSDSVDTGIRPVLDTMQTMPSFVYLVPGIMLFGLGNVAAIFATVLYALPPCIRLTNLGIRQVDPSVVEAGQSFGSSNIQLLFKIQIPMAIPTIMAGINQTVMMALAMSTIAAMVGAGGLGIEVLRAMGQLREGEAVLAGCAIVILAIIIDRISQGYIENRTS